MSARFIPIRSSQMMEDGLITFAGTFPLRCNGQRASDAIRRGCIESSQTDMVGLSAGFRAVRQDCSSD